MSSFVTIHPRYTTFYLLLEDLSQAAWFSGHSRTIIGVEQLKSGALRLLLFDPSCGTHQMAQFVNAPITGKLMRSLRRSPDSLRAKQYQIVAVRGVLTEAEFEVYNLVSPHTFLAMCTLEGKIYRIVFNLEIFMYPLFEFDISKAAGLLQMCITLFV